ncbi:MAG: 50S ribosomal protein L24 [Thermoleophilia bacterium]|nr:50S ribosomal protein L24 [Thermoleophilia bacterium]
MARIKKGDQVVVISGKDKGKTGRVLEVLPKKNRVIVEGVNIVKRHTKARPPEEPGGVIERPAAMDLSNVALIDPEDRRPTRVRYGELRGKKVRLSARSGHTIDND